jgi:hypothetical protein
MIRNDFYHHDFVFRILKYYNNLQNKKIGDKNVLRQRDVQKNTYIR